MSSWRSRLKRARRWLAGAFAALVILLAVAMALGQLLLPLLAHYPDRVAALLSERLHQPVSVRTVQGHWQGSGPLLSVSGLRIGSGEDALRLPEAELKVDFGAWIKRDRRWLELRLDGAVAHLEIDAGGTWHVSGVDLGRGAGIGGTEQLADLPVGLLLRHLELVVRDQRQQRTINLQVPALRVLTRNNELHLGGQVMQPGGGEHIDFAARFDPLQSSGRAYVAGEDVDLAAWDRAFGEGPLRLVDGRGEVRVWFGWHAGRPDRITADVDLSSLTLMRAGESVLELPRWRGRLQARVQAHAWRAHWQAGPDDRGETGGWLDVERHDSGDTMVRAQALDVQTLAPWLALWPADAEGKSPAIAQLRPWGTLDELRLDWRDARHFSLRATVHGLGWKAADGLPGIDHVDATVRGDGEATSIMLAPQAFTVNVPGVFRKPFVFSQASGTWSFWQGASGWRLATEDMQLRAADYALMLRGGLRQTPGRSLPTLDLSARVADAKVPAAKRFWPVNVMSPGSVAWLDRGLVSGDVSGRALFRGNLGDWPFAAHQGRFEAVADFRNAVLDYDPDWPQADKLDGRAAFVNLGMYITAEAGSSLGNRVQSASAEIAHFDHAELELDIRGRGRASRLLEWLRNTPVGREHRQALAAMKASGAARYSVKLKLPLHDDAGAATKLDGRVELADARFAVPDWSLELKHLDGTLSFDTGAIRARELTGDYNGVPVQLQVRIGDATHQANATVEAAMHGRFDMPALLRSYPSLDWLASLASGQADFDVGLSLRTDARSGRAEQQLSVDSNLRGMALTMPAPLHKPASASRHLHLELGLPLDGARLAVRLGEVAAANVRLSSADQPLAADVALRARAGVPPPRGIRVHGKVSELDVSGWLSRILAGSAGGGAGTVPSPISLQLDTAQAMIAGQQLGPLALDVSNEKNRILVALDGQALAGQVSVPMADISRSGITMRMDRLHWPETDDAQDKSGSGSVVAPAAIPPLHVWIRDLRLGQARLGDVRVESVPIADGMQIEQFEAQSPDLKISARGRWLGSAADSHSDFSMDISAEDMGRMLSAFGYGKLVAGGSTLVHIDGRWPGAPTDFSLARLDGQLKVHAADGRILEVEPGMGRLFGLFSIRELPRRLSLDFGDIFQSGYSFNSIDGQFRFDNGNAWTDDLEMLGPSADIRITGRTGVRQHDYDQQIVVTPHLGVALPVVGAIAGGPIGVAAGLAMQGLLGKGINRAGEARYKVTGSWDKPDIERISRESSMPPVPTAPPAASASAATASSVSPFPGPATSAPTGAASPGLAPASPSSPTDR